MMRRLKLLNHIMDTMGLKKLLLSFVLYLVMTAFLLVLVEPEIKTIQDGLWYCFVSCTTVGFGDIVVKTFFGKILTIILTLYGILVFAFIPGVVVSYFIEFNRLKSKESVLLFLDKLENLENLSKDELTKLSQTIKAKRYKL